MSSPIGTSNPLLPTDYEGLCRCKPTIADCPKPRTNPLLPQLATDEEEWEWMTVGRKTQSYQPNQEDLKYLTTGHKA